MRTNVLHAPVAADQRTGMDLRKAFRMHRGDAWGDAPWLHLALCHIEQLKARAFTVSGSIAGIARELILTGLA